ncbi:MAG: lipoyl(octanoyl) transferase LipB [Candidatus Kapabacteria bacterium]|nr:lipoyl(octanoyl) transferase LipB [Candidatus Kapabacteria bacterium]
MIEVQNWGLIDYEEAWARQKEIVEDIQKNRNRNVLVLCQHPSVITIGRAGSSNNVIADEKFLASLGIKVIYNDRGGDATLHNPGQLVGYPIFNLSSYKEDLHWFLREVEECIIELISYYGIKGERIKGLTGVWVSGNRKICAMGIHCSRWVTSHGFALNVANNLNEFNFIIPCGIKDKDVTSISREVGTDIDINEVVIKCIDVFKHHF